MSTPLANKVTLVTGASRGIGQAIAESQAANGANVVINYVRNMSVSGLHHKFKAITTMGPLQYQKQIRLQEARGST